MAIAASAVAALSVVLAALVRARRVQAERLGRDRLGASRSRRVDRRPSCFCDSASTGVADPRHRGGVRLRRLPGDRAALTSASALTGSVSRWSGGSGAGWRWRRRWWRCWRRHGWRGRRGGARRGRGSLRRRLQPPDEAVLAASSSRIRVTASSSRARGIAPDFHAGERPPGTRRSAARFVPEMYDHVGARRDRLHGGVGDRACSS